MEFRKDTSAGYLTNLMARLFAAELGARIRPLGITTGQFPILLELWEEDGLTQRELVRRVEIEQATMASTLARMERDGLIERRPDPRDARSQRIRLTPKAATLEAPAKDAALAVNEAALADVPQGERQRFVSTMRQVVASLRAGRGG